MSSNCKPSFDFHDPEFVRWWLQSHYLLPMNDQIALAETLRDRISLVAVQDAIDEFLDERVDGVAEFEVLEPIQVEQRAGQAMGAGEELRSMAMTDVAVASVRRLWYERRPLMLIFIAVVMLFAVRGLLALGHLARGILG